MYSATIPKLKSTNPLKKLTKTTMVAQPCTGNPKSLLSEKILAIMITTIKEKERKNVTNPIMVINLIGKLVDEKKLL